MGWYYVALHVDGAAPAAHVVRADEAAVKAHPTGGDEARGSAGARPSRRLPVGQLRLLRDGQTVFHAPAEYVLEWAACDTQRQAEDRARTFRERLRDAGRWRVEEGSAAPRVRRRRPGEAPPAGAPKAGSVLEGVRVRLEE